MTKLLTRAALALMVSVVAPLQAALAEEQLTLPLQEQLAFPFMAAPTAGIEGADLVPPPESGLQKISVRALDATEIDPSAIADQVRQLSNSDIVAVTEVLPDDSKAIPSAFFERARAINRTLAVKTHKKVRVSAKTFGDWFAKNKLRVTIIAFEVTVMTGLKFTELMISPVPIAYASAFTASLLLGSVLGGVEWNMPKLIQFIGKPGTLVSKMIERITGGAAASVGNQKSRKLLHTALQFAKNTEINFVLFGVFKILLFATTQTDGSFLQGIFESFQTLSGAEVGNWAKLALESTLVSFPTTKLIMGQHAANLKAAGTDPDLKARAMTRTTFLMSSALTARAVLFSSIIVAGALHWPLLAVTAYSGLGVMFAGSTYKLWQDARKSRINRCSALMATSAL